MFPKHLASKFLPNTHFIVVLWPPFRLCFNNITSNNLWLHHCKTVIAFLVNFSEPGEESSFLKAFDHGKIRHLMFLLPYTATPLLSNAVYYLLLSSSDKYNIYKLSCGADVLFWPSPILWFAVVPSFWKIVHAH